MEKPVQKVDAR